MDKTYMPPIFINSSDAIIYFDNVLCNNLFLLKLIILIFFVVL